jgi:hypothetical protein
MLHNPALQIVGDTGVEDGIVNIGHDVNAVLMIRHRYLALPVIARSVMCDEAIPARIGE